MRVRERLLAVLAGAVLAAGVGGALALSGVQLQTPGATAPPAPAAPVTLPTAGPPIVVGTVEGTTTTRRTSRTTTSTERNTDDG